MTPRSVVVTGGSRGLGAGLVQAFLDDGDRVATCSRTPTPTVKAWQDDPALADRFLYVPADLAVPSAADQLVKDVIGRFGGIDVLVNNAGMAAYRLLALMTEAELDAVVDLNLKATMRLTRRVVRSMLRQDRGRIITITSVGGIQGYQRLAAYGATKAALDGFTRALARELGPRGITVNSVAPGFLATEMTAGYSEEELLQIERRTPVGRLGLPEDVTGAVRFLASDEASFVTGHVLVVDGGESA